MNLKKIIQGRSLPILLSLVLTALTAWVLMSKVPVFNKLLTRLDHVYYDLRISHFKPQLATQIPIVIVDIDNKSLTELGRWPWPRRILTRLLAKLQQSEATVVAFDMIFAEHETNIADVVFKQFSAETLQQYDLLQEVKSLKQYFDHDKAFASRLAQGETVLGFVLVAKGQAPNSGALPTALWEINNATMAELALFNMEQHIGIVPSLLKSAKYGGFLSTFPDQDGVIRRTPLILRYQNKIYPTLSLQATALYLLINRIELDIQKIGAHHELEGIRFGKDLIRTDRHGQVLIPFTGPARSFTTFSAADILNGKINADKFKNTLVFIGSSALGLGDLKPTPFGHLYPGVEVHATVAAGLLSKHFPYSPVWAKGAELTILLVTGILLSIMLPFLNALLLNLFSISMLVVIIASNIWLWQDQNIALPVLLPLLLIILLWIFNLMYSFFSERSQRKEIKSIFGQYVPSQHIDAMLENPGSYGFEGESRELSVLFADIRDFTSISEKLSVTQLKQLLNLFFTEMTDIIFQHEGTIDKYVGDMVMAFWGAPLPNKDHAKNCVQAALKMQERCVQLQDKFTHLGYPTIRIGIGVNTGVMNIGDMGSKYRRNYTVLGDAVNLASRLEAATKFYNLPILVSEHTIVSQDTLIYRHVDTVRVKGKDEAIKVFQPLVIREHATTELMAELEQYQRGLDAYTSQSWDDGVRRFTELSQQFPDDPLYQLYLQRCRDYQAAPPSQWDGVFVFTEK